MQTQNFDKLLLKHLLFGWDETTVTEDCGVVWDLSEQRNSQSGFSFELEELSTKLADIEEAKKKDNSDT